MMILAGLICITLLIFGLQNRRDEKRSLCQTRDYSIKELSLLIQLSLS